MNASNAESGRPGRQASSVEAPATQTVTMFLWGIVGAAVLAFIAAFLPWATAAGRSVSGLSDGRDGVITLVLAIITAALAAAAISMPASLRDLPLIAGLTAIVTGVVLIVVSLVDILDVQDRNRDLGVFGEITGIEVSVGYGLWLTLLTGLLLIVLGLMDYIGRRRTE
ncbi:hypothetical protein [Gordonia sp. (in: high G+C Gram-positive bacteria)]|uniref:hypothetical protein n=1 Tax=Gordonia sp. (in: high G+C Gram-positive bacteria) TaxID=84139 RepID=UPI003C767FA3